MSIWDGHMWELNEGTIITTTEELRVENEQNYLVLVSVDYEGKSSYEFKSLAEVGKFLQSHEREIEDCEVEVFRIAEELNPAVLLESFKDTRQKAIRAARAKLTKEELELLGIG